MSLNRNTKDRKLSIQGLERREMMAGDVGVQFSNGVLDIDGDGSSNAVQVDQISDGRYVVQGLFSNGASTKINGGYSSHVYDGVTDINVEMGSGRDQLYLNGTNNYMQMLEGDLNIQMGYHNDDVRIKNFWVTGDAIIATDYADNSWNAPSQGDDYLQATNFVTYGKLNVNTAEGSDKVDFSTTQGGWNAFHEGVSIDTGYGMKDGDDIVMKRVFTWQGIDIDMSNGHDTFYGREIMSYHGDVTIDTFYGNDQVTVYDSHMDWQYTNHNTSLKVNTGSGNDDVVLQDIDVRGDVRVTTSSGHDDVYMHDIHAKDDIYANLGSGNDNLTLKSSSAAVAYLYGGSNSSSGDKFTQHDNDIDILIKSGWEWL